MSIAAIAGITAFVIRELKIKNPVVDLKVLKNRNVLVGAALSLAFGMPINVSVFLYPVFVQGFLGWNATRTGLLILPSSFLTGMLMGLNGTLLQKGVSPKILVLVGFAAVIGYEIITYFLATPASGEWNWFWPQMIRGFGFGFIFVPVAGLTLSGLKGNEIAQASGLSNMLGLLGGAIGIAVTNTFVTRRFATHRADLIGNISLYNPESNERFFNLVKGCQSQGKSLSEAQQMAAGALEGAVSFQSAVISYSEGFLLIGIIFQCILPLVFFAKINKGEKVDLGLLIKILP